MQAVSKKISQFQNIQNSQGAKQLLSRNTFSVKFPLHHRNNVQLVALFFSEEAYFTTLQKLPCNFDTKRWVKRCIQTDTVFELLVYFRREVVASIKTKINSEAITLISNKRMSKIELSQLLNRTVNEKCGLNLLKRFELSRAKNESALLSKPYSCITHSARADRSFPRPTSFRPGKNSRIICHV